MRQIGSGARDREQDRLPGKDLFAAVVIWAIAIGALPLRGAWIPVVLLGAAAVVAVGCVWEPRRSGVDWTSLGWRLPMMGASVAAGLMVMILGISPTYASLGEGVRMACIFTSVALVGVPTFVLKKQPGVASPG